MISFPLNFRVLRGKICTTQGPETYCAMQVDFDERVLLHRVGSVPSSNPETLLLIFQGLHLNSDLDFQGSYLRPEPGQGSKMDSDSN